jgi:hypothetical protein
MSNDKLRDPFNPDGGEFAKNIRSITGVDDTELRQSLNQFGWLPDLPALADENGVILVGHRRIRLAKQLDIEPVIKTLRIGKGDEADAKRLALAIASNLGHAPMTRDDRKRIAEYLYGQREWTMQRIAEALNVGTMTVHRDLANFTNVVKSKPSKTASNPKGAGRPKGTKHKAPKPHDEADRIIAAHDSNPDKTYTEIAAEVGVTARTVRREIEQENIRREAQADIDPATLSMTAQAKLDLAIKQHIRKLDHDFMTRVNERANQHVNEYWLPEHKKLIADAKLWAGRRKGLMDKATFTKIWACLHTERLAQLIGVAHDKLDEKLARRYAEAFQLFSVLEKHLLDEKDSPTNVPPLPSTVEELMAAKARATAARKAKRGASNISRRV